MSPSRSLNMLSLISRITAYENKLRDLKSAFLGDVALQTGITAVRMVDVVQDIESVDLNDMPCAEARCVLGKECLPGTRQSLLEEICDSPNDPADDAPRVCLLTGVTGSRKSAVAHSIARLYDGQKRLASSYCFASTDAKKRNLRNLFSTIACDLCDHNLEYKSALREIVKDNRALRTSTSPLEQLQRFIIVPHRDRGFVGPQLVTVIDALDESEDQVNRQVLLQAISNQLSENALPTNTRFLIIVRPESDILEKLPSGPHLVHEQMGSISIKIIDRDIERSVHHSLDENPYLALPSIRSGVAYSSVIRSNSFSGLLPRASLFKEVESIHTGNSNYFRRVKMILQCGP